MATMIIRLNNSTPVAHSERTLPSAFENISAPTLAQMLERGFAEYTRPVYDPATQRTGNYVPLGEGWTREVIDIPQAEMDAAEAARVASTIDSVNRAARDYVDERLHPTALLVVDRLVRRDPPSVRGAAVEAWVNAVYTESYYRQALIEAGMWPDNEDPCDFSSLGDKPHTVPQLLAEL